MPESSCGEYRCTIAEWCSKTWKVTLFLVQPGGACSALSICTGGSSCSNGICACPPKTFISEGACKPSHISSRFTFVTLFKKVDFGSGVPGESCTSQTECTGGSFCFNSYCTCPQGQVIFDRKCVPFVATGLFIHSLLSKLHILTLQSIRAAAALRQASSVAVVVTAKTAYASAQRILSLDKAAPRA